MASLRKQQVLEIVDAFAPHGVTAHTIAGALHIPKDSISGATTSLLRDGTLEIIGQVHGPSGRKRNLMARRNVVR